MNKTLKIIALPAALLVASGLTLAYAKSGKQEKAAAQPAPPSVKQAPMSCCSAPASKSKLLSTQFSIQATSATAEKK